MSVKRITGSTQNTTAKPKVTYMGSKTVAPAAKMSTTTGGTGQGKGKTSSQSRYRK